MVGVGTKVCGIPGTGAPSDGPSKRRRRRRRRRRRWQQQQQKKKKQQKCGSSRRRRKSSRRKADEAAAAAATAARTPTTGARPGRCVLLSRFLEVPYLPPERLPTTYRDGSRSRDGMGWHGMAKGEAIPQQMWWKPSQTSPCFSFWLRSPCWNCQRPINFNKYASYRTPSSARPTFSLSLSCCLSASLRLPCKREGSHSTGPGEKNDDPVIGNDYRSFPPSRGPMQPARDWMDPSLSPFLLSSHSWLSAFGHRALSLRIPMACYIPRWDGMYTAGGG